MHKSPQKPSKSYKPDLKTGVSAESPAIFHLKFTSILNSDAKNRAVSGTDRNPGTFLSNLKQNRPYTRTKFNYEDYSTPEAVSFDILPFKEQIDLLQNEEKRLRCRTPFFQKWNKQQNTVEMFKLTRGDFTVEANQIKIERQPIGKIRTLKNLLEKQKTLNKSQRDEKGSKGNKTEVRFMTADKKFRRTKYLESDLNSEAMAQQEIRYFENKLVLVPERKRWCYN